jgi:hypothetical protein
MSSIKTGYYVSGSFTATFVMNASSDSTGLVTLHYTRTGNLVTLLLPAMSASANTTTDIFLTSGSAALPPVIQPTIDDMRFPCQVITGGTNVIDPGCVRLRSDGTIDIYYRCDLSSAWTNATTNGLQAQVGVSYLIT